MQEAPDFAATLFNLQHDPTILEPQPMFPEEDLTDQNAAFLDMYLQDDHLVDASHQLSEQRVRIFELAHGAVTSKDVMDSPARQASFSQGFTLYEVMHNLVKPNGDKDPLKDHVAAVAAEWLAIALRGDRQNTYIINAVDEFGEKQPRAAKVIENAARRIHPAAASYAVAGAAIERQIELEALAIQTEHGIGL